MDLTLAAVYLGLYLLGMPLTLSLISLAYTRLWIKRRLEKAALKKQVLKNPPQRLWPRLRERVGFTLRDKRSVQLGKNTLSFTNQQLFFSIWGLGLVLFLAVAVLGKFILIIPGVILFYSAVIFGFFSPRALLQERRRVLNRMFAIANSRLGASPEYRENPAAIIDIKEWRDYVKPTRVEIQVPDTFSQEGSEGFMRQFNQVFGQQTTWVPADDPENQVYGWDFEAGKVTLYEVPPLPQRAAWQEHYITSEGISWSFFPIGLGVAQGVELTNPETGMKENVIGFDVAGLQGSVGEAAGLKVSKQIVTAPQALVAGKTGGGKALAADTPVLVLRPLVSTPEHDPQGS